ncbi:MAG: LysR family transcriptional regulator [Pseudobdellovibrionaceae bacterium]|nr:LysR family transcriptional regulator [Bdellovibrionales bacterium]USN48972.1 MAG: LysR family transcriptional regulator [Pseudobdellovibrionaceae bacterium]
MTAAAEKLFLTQPAVSQQIRALEDEMGVSLLVRGVRQVKPTMQGQLLYDYAKRILHLTQQAEIAIQTISQDISGDLRIATTNSFGLYLIGPIVGLFLKHNTSLNMKLTYGTARDIIEDMRHNRVDVAVLPDLKNEYGIELDDFEGRFVLKDEMWLVASGKDATIPPSITMDQFASMPIVGQTDYYPGFGKKLYRRLEELKVPYKPVFESDNVGTLKRVVESGLGWGFLPSHSIKKQVRARRMTHIRVDEMNYSVNVNMYARRAEGLSQMVEVFYRAIQQQALTAN